MIFLNDVDAGNWMQKNVRGDSGLFTRNTSKIGSLIKIQLYLKIDYEIYPRET